MDEPNNKPINAVINSTEKTILTGNISGIYKEIEKTEKIIHQNIERLLINLYNSFQVMDNKKKLIEYLTGFEKENISENDLNALKEKASVYRNVELPRKWNDMKQKLIHTKELIHFKAWYFALQQGRYENVVSNIKEYIVKEILKNILERFPDEKKSSFNKDVFFKLLSENDMEKLKKEYKKIFSGNDIIRTEPVYEFFDLFFLYLLYLNSDMSLEIHAFENIFKELSAVKKTELKIKFLKSKNNEIVKSINNEKLQENIKNILNAFIELYESLEASAQKEKENAVYKTAGNISELVETLLTFNTPPEAQKYLKFQIENQNEKDELYPHVLKLLFYLFSTENKDIRKKIIGLCDRVKLKTDDKQKYLKLLKSYSQNNVDLKELLKIKNEDIAFASLYVLFQNENIEKRIKKIDNLKNAEEEQILKYKEFFEISNNTINEVVKFLKNKYSKKEEQSETAINEEEPVYLPREQKEYKPYEIEQNDTTGFTQNEVKEIFNEKQTMTNKSTAELISEQKIRSDYKKINELINKKIAETTAAVNKEILNSIRTKAHEIYEDKNKKKEDKIGEILAFLTTCFPEAVSKILSDEILPVFRTDTIDLEMHNTLEGINDTIFKPALDGADIRKNISFIENKISKVSFENIKTIVLKIKKIREEEGKKIEKALTEAETHKKNEQKTAPAKKENFSMQKPVPAEENIIVDNTPFENDSSLSEVEKNIEETLIGLTNFIKPHLVILNIARQFKNTSESEYDAEKRKSIIEKLFEQGKIFTYDGSNYIGYGQINNIIKSNAIPSADKSVFIKKLDNFIERFKTKEELNGFLGVNDEMELRKLNYSLDKFGVARKITSPVLNNESKDEKEKPHPVKKALRAKEFFDKSKDVIKNTGLKMNEEISKIDKPLLKEKKAEQIQKPAPKKEMDLKKIKNDEANFINSAQKEVLATAYKEINKNLEKLIKQTETKNDMDAIARNYFGSAELNKRNLLNLCYDIKKIAEIINKDRFLFSKLSYDKEKTNKLFESKMKKLKK